MEIRHYQKTTHLLLRKAPFMRVVSLIFFKLLVNGNRECLSQSVFEITMPFNNTRTLKFKSQLTCMTAFFTAVNHDYDEPTNPEKRSKQKIFHSQPTKCVLLNPLK